MMYHEYHFSNEISLMKKKINYFKCHNLLMLLWREIRRAEPNYVILQHSINNSSIYATALK